MTWGRRGDQVGGVGDLGLIRRATSQIIISNLHHIDCSSQEQVNYVSIELWSSNKVLTSVDALLAVIRYFSHQNSISDNSLCILFIMWSATNLLQHCIPYPNYPKYSTSIYPLLEFQSLKMTEKNQKIDLRFAGTNIITFMIFSFLQQN